MRRSAAWQATGNGCGISEYTTRRSNRAFSEPVGVVGRGNLLDNARLIRDVISSICGLMVLLWLGPEAGSRVARLLSYVDSNRMHSLCSCPGLTAPMALARSRDIDLAPWSGRPRSSSIAPGSETINRQAMSVTQELQSRDDWPWVARVLHLASSRLLSGPDQVGSSPYLYLVYTEGTGQEVGKKAEWDIFTC